MKYRPELFRDHYNLDALQRIRPPGHRFEPLTSALIRSVSRRKKVLIAVGAHNGFFIVLAGIESPQLEIQTLEPIPENMEILRRNPKLAAIKPVLAAREEEIANLEQSREHQAAKILGLNARLEEAEQIPGRLRSSRLGRLALWITREK